ncbi:MAG TPA: hypothetical protein VFY90_00725 [Tepidiformaceae bacterium]|nr:hypothetical protein [Tepidiformaceae bacterium]
MAGDTYPADQSQAALRLFLRWFGAQYARSTRGAEQQESEGLLEAVIRVGREWTLSARVVNTLSGEADLAFETARAAIERRLDAEGKSLALWVPRGAVLPDAEPRISEIIAATDTPATVPDGRGELRMPVTLHLRRVDTTGSVITILGGLGASWAQFTNRVPGSFQLNSLELHRLPADPAEREALAERIVLAAAQPDVDESLRIPAEDAWTVNDLEAGGSCVLGSPRPDNDEQSAALRRNLRLLLKDAQARPRPEADARALIVLGAATYADEEKLSWALRGMDPTLYSGYDLILIVADGMVKSLLQPGRQTLPWDAPAG